MRPLILLFCITWLTACSSSPINEDAVNQFQSLTKNQQADYWQQKRVQYASAELQKVGAQVFNKGEEYQIVVPSALLFKGATPSAAKGDAAIYQKIVNLLNSEPTSSLTVLAYTITGNKQRDFSLTEDWAHTVMEQIRDKQLITPLVNAQGKGTCLNYPTSNAFASRIEIHYRIQVLD